MDDSRSAGELVRSQALHYMQAEILELRRLSNEIGSPMVTYLLDMAVMEIRDAIAATPLPGRTEKIR